MRIYNPKEWFGILFQFHKSDTLRKLLGLIFIIALYATIVVFVEANYFKTHEDSPLKNFSIMHTILGLALSLLLVFRTNTAYDRWWEGRKLWGALVNNSRNLAIKLHTLLDDTDEYNRDFFRRAIPMYAFVLKDFLQAEATRYSLDEEEHHELKNLDADKHTPNQVAKAIMARAMLLHNEQKITGEQLYFINNELSSFTDICGACERIKNTPIPYSYSAFIKKFIFIYIMTLPIAYSFSLGYLSVLVVSIVFYVLGSLELIAEEIEDPFGKDSNDLPMERIALNIEKHVAEIL